MKFLKTTIASCILCALLFSTNTPFGSCTKKQTQIVVDTVYDIQDGLVAYYNFNGGNLNDSSGFGNNIVFNSATKTSDRFGNPNNAYQFDGSTSYMRITNSPSLDLNNITMMAIVKVGGFNTGACHANEIIGKGSPDNINGFYILRFSDAHSCSPPADSLHENFVAQFGDNDPQGTAAGVEADTLTVAKGVWYTIIYTFDGQVSKMYINGVLKNSLAKTAGFAPNAHDLLIGRHDDATFPYWFTGAIDEVRIYNRALPIGAIHTLSTLKN